MGGAGRRSAVFRDTGRMRGVFAEHLRWGDGGRVDVRSCTVAYVHDAPTRCLLHYDLTVRDPDTGVDRAELVTGFVSGEDRAEQVARKILETAPAPAPARLIPVVPVPELDLVLQVFPFDQRLPALHRLMTGSAPLVASAILADLGPGEWRITRWRAEAARYRVDQRAMVRLTVEAHDRASDATRERRAYAKVFRDSADGQRAFDVQRALWNRVGEREAAFAVARPVAYVAAAQTLLFDEVAGTSLRQVLADPADPSAAIRQTARAMAALHQLALDEVDVAARRRPVRDELVRLEKAASALRPEAPVAGDEIDRIVAGIGTHLSRTAVGPTHFDLKPGHVLFGPAGTTLLDFDKLTVADPMVDVANLLVFLGKERVERAANRGEHDLVRTFSDEYFAQVPESWRSGFPAAYALALLVEAATAGRGMRGRGERSDRAATVTSLIHQAGRVLDGHL